MLSNHPKARTAWLKVAATAAEAMLACDRHHLPGQTTLQAQKLYL